MNRIYNKKAIYIAAAVLLAVLIYVWGVSPVINYKQEIVQGQEAAEKRLKKLKKLKRKYEMAQKSGDEISSMGNKSPDFTLFSYLEKQASKKDIKKNIEFMRPSTQELSSGVKEKQVELRIGNVSLSKLSDFLQKVEFAPEAIFIKRITIRSPKDDPGNLQVSSVIVTYR